MLPGGQDRAVTHVNRLLLVRLAFNRGGGKWISHTTGITCACTLCKSWIGTSPKQSHRPGVGQLVRSDKEDFPGVGNSSSRPRSCENMISDAGVARQRWLAPAGAPGQAAIACISGLRPKILIIRSPPAILSTKRLKAPVNRALVIMANILKTIDQSIKAIGRLPEIRVRIGISQSLETDLGYRFKINWRRRFPFINHSFLP